MTLTERAQRILELQVKATPGPWHVEGASYGMVICHPIAGARYPHDIAVVRCPDDAPSEPDAAFIAAAHESADIIRELLAENERLRGSSQSTGTWIVR